MHREGQRLEGGEGVGQSGIQGKSSPGGESGWRPDLHVGPLESKVPCGQSGQREGEMLHERRGFYVSCS